MQLIGMLDSPHVRRVVPRASSLSWTPMVLYTALADDLLP